MMPVPGTGERERGWRNYTPFSSRLGHIWNIGKFGVASAAVKVPRCRRQLALPETGELKPSAMWAAPDTASSRAGAVLAKGVGKRDALGATQRRNRPQTTPAA